MAQGLAHWSAGVTMIADEEPGRMPAGVASDQEPDRPPADPAQPRIFAPEEAYHFLGRATTGLPLLFIPAALLAQLEAESPLHSGYLLGQTIAGLPGIVGAITDIGDGIPETDPARAIGRAATVAPTPGDQPAFGTLWWLNIPFPGTGRDRGGCRAWHMTPDGITGANLMLARPFDVAQPTQAVEPAIVVTEAEVTARTRTRSTAQVVATPRAREPVLVIDPTPLPYNAWPRCSYCGRPLAGDYHLCSCLIAVCTECRRQAGGCIKVDCPESPPTGQRGVRTWAIELTEEEIQRYWAGQPQVTILREEVQTRQRARPVARGWRRGQPTAGVLVIRSEDLPARLPHGADDDLRRQERRMLDLVNADRAAQRAEARGGRPLQWDEQVAEVARAHCRDMLRRDYMAHENPDGLTPFDRLQRAGVVFIAAGENLAGAPLRDRQTGYPSIEAAQAALMASPGHRANCLNPQFTHLGIGIVRNADRTLVITQNYITPP